MDTEDRTREPAEDREEPRRRRTPERQEPRFTPRQVLDNTHSLASGHPSWVVREALKHAGLLEAELLTVDEVRKAIAKHQTREVPREPMPGEVSA